MDILLEKLPLDLRARIWVKKETGCWIWIKEVDKYARLKYDGKFWLVHRLVFILLVGNFPEGHESSHVCRNKRCCRPHPNHVIPETRLQNLRRDHPYFDKEKILKRRQEKATEKNKKIRLESCPQGHPKIPENKLGATNKCKICHSERIARRRKKEKSLIGLK